MLYIIWVLQSTLSSFWMILSKKVLENKKIWNNLQTFFTRFSYFLIILTVLYFWFFWLSFSIPDEFLGFWNIFLFVSSTLLLYTTYPLRRIAYANEKISVLQPFAMLNQIFPIIIWFMFVASERTSLSTFLIALIVSFFVIFLSVDFKNIRINNYSLMVLTSSLIKSVQVFAVLYFLKMLNPVWFFLFETLIVIIISIFLLFLRNERWEIKLITKAYAKIFFLSCFVSLVAILLNLTLYVNIWIIATSLLNLLYLVFVYILSYIFFWDKPSRKDVFLSFLIVFAILLSSYLKLKWY